MIDEKVTIACHRIEELWHESNGKFVQSTPTNARVFELNNIKLYHIENVRDKTIAKGNIYRYKYSVTP